MEVCVDSLESAINAYEGNADRIELCSSLNEGGLTPSYGLLKCIIKYIMKSSRPFGINCMIRCRAGDFNYSDTELETMREDINKFVELEVDGIVFGALDAEGFIDEAASKELLKLVPPNVQTTFHRAFDVCLDWEKCFNQIETLGFDKLLTSGQQKTAFEGRHLIAKLNAMSANSKIQIIPGCGINSTNLEQILEETKCLEFHASCRSTRESKMIYKNKEIPMGSTNDFDSEFQIKYTDKAKVKELADIFNKYKSKNFF